MPDQTTTPNASTAAAAGVRPPIQGQVWTWRDGRYRVYTIDHVPFDRFPEYPDGPATVVLGDWGVSYSSLDRIFSSPSVIAADDGMVTLKAYRCGTPFGQPIPRHELDGTKYPTRRAATRAAYEAGLVGFMVYERDAAGYGLPVDD